jgi:hypothetical protein
MTTPQAVDLTPAEAAGLIDQELAEAGGALHAHDLDTALDGYVRAMGLALQLGPAPSEQVLAAILQAARKLTLWQDADGLSALGPALVELVTQVREASALPRTAVMETWATFTSDLGALIGQLGLALAIPPGHRAGMMDLARTRAALLDDATGSHFTLTAWLDEAGSQKAEDASLLG